jgi:pre-mRNA-processing factor 6
MTSYGESRWGKAPPGYIPGYGRGAVGFTTRSDIGPARNVPGPNEYNINNKYSPSTASVNQNQPKPEENDLKDYSETRYDRFEGYQGENLFSNTEYDEEDRDADFEYNLVEKRMGERRKSRTEKKIADTLMKIRNERPTIREQFSDLRKELTTLKPEDWDRIQDIGDFTVKKRKIERYTPNTDRNIMKGLLDGQVSNVVDPLNKTGMETPITQYLGQSGLNETTNLNELGTARNKVLSYEFDKISNSVSGQSSVNPIGYITEMEKLGSMSVINQTAGGDVNDIKKARTILKSVVSSDPKNAKGWVAAARLEELDGKLQEARNIIAQAAENILDSEDIWLEATRLHPPEAGKVILAKAISHLPNSEKLWLTAAKLEIDKIKRSKILRKALLSIPSSEELWRQAIEIETNPNEAKELLSKAVECVPNSSEMWLALARLETYNKAKGVLNRARKALPADHAIWVHAAKLEEAERGDECPQATIDILVERGIKTLIKNGAVISNEKWLKEAENSEMSGSVKTCKAIVKAAIKNDKETNPSDVMQLWMNFCEISTSDGCIQTSRSILEELVNLFPDDTHLWIEWIKLEQTYGSDKTIGEVLEKAVKSRSHNDVFWLMYAKHKWLTESINSAKTLLENALKEHPGNEDILLAMVKLEKEDNNYNRAEEILKKARENEESSSAKIWMQSVQLLRETGKYDAALKMCEEGISRFTKFYKFYLIKAQILYNNLNNRQEAITTYEECIKDKELGLNSLFYINFRKLYKENQGTARSILERGLINIPQGDQISRNIIYADFVKFELEMGNSTSAKLTLNRGLKELPESGLLWSLAIEMEPAQTKHSKAADALNKAANSEYVMTAIANVYVSEKNIEKARKWFDNAVRTNKDFGDAWIYYYKAELTIGERDHADSVINRCEKAKPRYGDLWTSISKKVENWKLKTQDILIKAIDLIK